MEAQYRINAPRTERMLWYIGTWLDDADNIREVDIVLDAAHRWTTTTEPIETWGSQLGFGRQLVRDLKRLAPEATSLIGFAERKVMTYTEQVGANARRELRFRTVPVAWREDCDSGLDTGVLHGPAGRDIEWGCHPLPRYDEV